MFHSNLGSALNWPSSTLGSDYPAVEPRASDRVSPTLWLSPHPIQGVRNGAIGITSR